MTLEDAVRFWRTEFTKSMPADKFDKQYAYGVRYNYGKEGKRTDYTPYSCMKIITSAPSTGDHHGCPFRHFEKEQFTTTLRKNGVSSTHIAEIAELVKNHHYQVPLVPGGMNSRLNFVWCMFQSNASVHNY